jgi:hypothetical protein
VASESTGVLRVEARLDFDVYGMEPVVESVVGDLTVVSMQTGLSVRFSGK